MFKMKNYMRLLHVLPAYACMAGGIAAERVANGSFENKLINELPAEWELFCPQPPTGRHENWTQGPAACFAIDTQTRHMGKNSIRISSALPTRCAILQRRIPGRAGDKWKLSFWMKGDSLNVKPEPGAMVRLAYLNSNDRDITSRLAPLSRAFSSQDHSFDWRRYEAQGEVPGEVDSLQLELFLWKSAGTVWFDDISLDISPSDIGSPDTNVPDVDRAGLLRHRSANTALLARAKNGPRVVFMGDSITDEWNLKTSFPDDDFINRGIGGQLTWQMVSRFREDALDMKPDVVVFLGGTNDIGGNVPFDIILKNIQSMIRACHENNIPMLVLSVLPVSDYVPAYPRTPRRPPKTICEFNKALQTLCRAEKAHFLDLHPVLADATGLLGAEFSRDGLHLNEISYKAVAPLVLKAIREELDRGKK
jgi:lysophospholipase L1-like esterase